MGTCFLVTRGKSDAHYEREDITETIILEAYACKTFIC